MDLSQVVAEPIEIKMGREVVYREGYVDKDPVNIAKVVGAFHGS